MPHPRLTALNRYDLIGTAEAFTAAVSALSDRVAREGEAGVLGYRFFVNPAARSAHAVVDYASGAAWIGHHEIAMPWPEMKAMHGVARLAEVTFLGDVTDDIRAWLAASTLTADIRDGNRFAAGFTR